MKSKNVTSKKSLDLLSDSLLYEWLKLVNWQNCTEKQNIMQTVVLMLNKQ